MELNGTNTGVFMSATLSESELKTIFETKTTGFGILGQNKSMMANRISYFLNLTGKIKYNSLQHNINEKRHRMNRAVSYNITFDKQQNTVLGRIYFETYLHSFK